MLKRWVATCVVIGMVAPATAWPASQASPTPACKPAGSTIRLAELPEVSGLVAANLVDK